MRVFIGLLSECEDFQRIAKSTIAGPRDFSVNFSFSSYADKTFHDPLCVRGFAGVYSSPHVGALCDVQDFQSP